ncbi:MAG: flavodoxin family protein [Theionarchaea archaeon]|nr:flavodoxin family protein [Theionarchaea archaeon]MBU7000727.1 flavodoxin family protein [Theionarchaea archaeon]MBU7021490.1 flavodoxin family protein [Theionarchaea archaeon]MBU7033569.1 flavodoxin family protein [Theionarchaea archaeon]MBU7039621.1 flavodoxin family protein [Theionarchaea archaeon]
MSKEGGVRALGIVGSPRLKGNTDILVDAVLEGTEEAGAVSEKIILNELRILPCRACNVCHTKRECVQQDDMLMVLKKMQQSTVWVLGTPVYWWGPSAQFKAFMDRWYGADKAIFQGKKAILVISLGGSESYAKYTVGILTSVLEYLTIEHAATVLAPGGINGNPHLVERARQIGQESITRK